MRAEVAGCGAWLMARGSCRKPAPTGHQLQTVKRSVFSVISAANESKG